jgi:DNA-binding NarL/FixJ family response regulator
MIRVLVADDQRVVREGLVTLLGLLDGVDVVGAAGDGEEVLTLAAELHPDVVLMDLRMPRCDGVDATRRLRGLDANIKVLMLTTYADERSVIEALRAGARGYLTKDAGADEIHAALRQVTGGRAAIDPAVQHHVVDAITAGPASATGSALAAPAVPDAAPAATRPAAASGTFATSATSGVPGATVPADEVQLPAGLTRREAEVLGLIALGLSNREIAERLYVNETTVKSHVNHLFAKTGVRDRAQAVAYAYRHGLVRTEPD